MARTYEDALALLNSRRRKARPTSPATPSSSQALSSISVPNLSDMTTLRGIPSLHGMSRWLDQLGHSETDLNNLNIVHVAGTKGKGSTCAFVNSFLNAHRERKGTPAKIGMYTSPHLTCIRERIRINSRKISEEAFAKYTFEVWGTWSSRVSRAGAEVGELPRYLQFLALLAMHIFIKEKVDVAVFETHHGGEYDATNIFRKPIASGVTTIDLDHVEQLGPTIEDVAWHKAGIFKSGIPAFSSPQRPEVAEVLQRRAAEKGVVLKFIQEDPRLPANAAALKPGVQRINSSLSLALTDCYLEHSVPKQRDRLAQIDVNRGIENFFWRGRFQHIVDGNYHWYLDGAHNELSVEKAGQWFVKVSTETQGTELPPTRNLIFSHDSARDGVALLTSLMESLRGGGLPHIQNVIFTTYNAHRPTRNNSVSTPGLNSGDLLQVQENYAQVWRKFDPKANILIEPSIRGALQQARRIGDLDGGAMQTLITGSLYLVGGALSFLDPYG